MADLETWTAEECAAAWGVKTPTWLGYVSRGQAPSALPERDADGRRLWDAEEVRAFPRPGPAGRGPGREPTPRRCSGRCARSAERIDELRPPAGAARGGQGAGPGDRADGGGAGHLPPDRLQLARRPLTSGTVPPDTLVHTAPAGAQGGTCAPRTSGVHAGPAPVRRARFPTPTGPLWHRRRVQVTVEPDALAEWSAHARRTAHAATPGSPRSTAVSPRSRRPGTAPPPTRFAARHRQWQRRGRGAARHAGRARRAWSTPPAPTTWPPSSANARIWRLGLAAAVVDARDGHAGAGADLGGPRGRPGGGGAASSPRSTTSPRRGTRCPPGLAEHGRHGRGRRRRRGLRRRLQRHGRGGLAGLAQQRAHARRDRRRSRRDREQPGQRRDRLDAGPPRPFPPITASDRADARPGLPRRRSGAAGGRPAHRVLADRGRRARCGRRRRTWRASADGLRGTVQPGVRRRRQAGRRRARTWRCRRCAASPARRCPTTPPPA